ncbi:hypothetical protein DE146DRAFT_383024 [Phaeosphaeria sp. MPI-PUGE-AT-0046c]|nr:hypothetical protein DE146DRAFT_383024 [Phaeosphaeria sp. MPI-PUGE-AT-0046c]
MTAQDHALAHLAAADETAITVTGPASPPRRDPVEDANPSFTRKRPRLDSGSNSIRPLSAEPDSSADTVTSPREPQVEMTIRSHPPSSPVPAAVEQGQQANGTPETPQNTSPVIMASTEDDAGSPSVELVESEDDESVAEHAIHMDPEDYFHQFPWSSTHHYTYVVRDLPKYFQNQAAIDGRILDELSQWLDHLPKPSADIHGFYVAKYTFWEDFAAAVSKLLNRRHQWMNALSGNQSTEQCRYPFGDAFDDDVHVDAAFDRFFSSYVKLCSSLFFVDALVLSQHAPEETTPTPLFSQRHMRHLCTIFRTDKCAVLHALHKEYGVDARELNMNLQKHFLEAKGAQRLLRLMEEIFHRVVPGAQCTYATYASQLFSTLAWTIFELPGSETFINPSEYHHGIRSFFQSYSPDLFDLSMSIDSNIVRDLVHVLAILVQDLCQLNERIAAELVDQVLDFDDPESPTMSSVASSINTEDTNYRQDPSCYPTLVANAWKFKLLRKYIVKGNMALRVMSIGSMDGALVDIWREFSAIDQSCKHPVIQFLADFLLRGRVVDYIVSVDSHPQLISRSGNITGFLIIAHRWSDNQADAMWRPVSSSLDPRVVAATITMIGSIINLMAVSDRLYLCTKLYDLPIERYTIAILRFFRSLTTTLLENNNHAQAIDYEEHGSKSRPWNVCIRVMRDTAPSRTADKNSLDLHVEAFDQLRCLIAAISSSERRTMYQNCAQQIAEQTDRATGSFRIMTLLMQYPIMDDNIIFQENHDLICSIVKEIPTFVARESQAGHYTYQLQALHYRLEYLRGAIIHPAMLIPHELYKDLWDHMIGGQALSIEARDMAWGFLLQSTKVLPQNDFCKQLVSSYLPALDPQFYTLGLFEFVANYHFPIIRQQVETCHGDDIILQIPGASLLWPILLSSPSDTIEDHAARLLATRYVRVIDEHGVSVEEAEKAHVALAEQCIHELRAAMEILLPSFKAAINVDDPKTSDTGELNRSQMHVERILLFQKLFLECVRQRPEYNRGRRIDSKVDTIENDVPYGNAITVDYQCIKERQSVTMASDHTIDDLYRRLCHATGFTKINLFARGRRLDMSKEGAIKLSEVNLGGLVIVQRAEGAELTRPLPALGAGSSVFEAAVVKHFDELFAWMNSTDKTSQLLFDFLTFFPARSTFADSVAQGEASVDSLFPPGKVFQAKYAAMALQARLRDDIHNSTMDENFLGNAIQHLDKALLNTQLMSESFSGPEELPLAAMLVGVLLEFLKERPTTETSNSYFSADAQLVDRLMSIVSVSLQSSQSALAAQSSYATILEASLHSRAVWEAFTHHSDVHQIHCSLLLVQSGSARRESIARKIASICGGDLPSTCPITRAETASRFWSIISAILPQAGQYAGNSKQLFEIAEHVFRTNDEYDRNETQLRSLLTQWSGLLLDHEHEEFPGREDSDHIVLGFTKLLLCCLLSIKSFKKPVNAGSLMKDVFKKYIFVTSARPSDWTYSDMALPILESHTRQELYDLMLALAEDRTTYDALLQLAGDIENEETDPALSTILVDRSAEIRSATGYVGLYNPRAICYMNSLLTQLFMNMNFRRFMLGLDVKEASGSQRLLFETQKLFAQMQQSFRKWTDPREFAACVKSIDKTPIDITVQMDADEFYNLLFDQWEAQLLQSQHKQQFRSFYGGQTLNQIKSKECEHVSERVEPFFAIQCDIAGKANLQESLQAYVQGDVMEGDNKYKCESCDGKFVDAVKRTCLKEAPDNLIFHLKRFEFDLSDFSRRKVYDHFAFPESLDISPYKIDHLANPSQHCAEDTFDLVGVLVHTGTCENGHYYSYIRQRPSPSADTEPKWIEFNDSEVGPFNPDEIADRTFGGFTEGDGYNRQIKQFSAYMLFYQRRTAIDHDQHAEKAAPPPTLHQSRLPIILEEETRTSNEQFIREYSLFDPVHAKFLRQLHAVSRMVNHSTCSEDHGQETRALYIVLAHLSKIAWRQHNADIFLDLLHQLRQSMMSCPTCCSIALEWLAKDDHAITNTVLKCTHSKVRTQMRTLLIDSLKFLRDKEPVVYGMEPADGDMDIDSIASKKGLFAKFVSRLRATADESSESTRGWEDYYLMLTQMAELGHMEIAVILNHGFLLFCLRLFSLHAIPQYKADNPEFVRIMDKRRTIFNRLVCFVWTLLSHMDLSLPLLHDSQLHDRLPSMDRDSTKFPLLRREAYPLELWSEDLKANPFVDKILEVFDESKTDHFYPGDIIRWMLDSQTPGLEGKLYCTMLEGFTLDPPYLDSYIRAALPFCEACTQIARIVKIISTIVGMITPDTVLPEERQPSGGVLLQFFTGLLTAQNDELFLRKHPHVFHQLLMLQSRGYCLYLLCHYDERVRKGSYVFFERLYANDEAIPLETVKAKYKTARALLTDLMHKFAHERSIGHNRSFMMPLVDTCRLLAQQLCLLTSSEEEGVEELRHPNDMALISQFNHEVENRLASWSHDAGTPISQSETFDQSDYGSESDDAHDLLDN